MTKQNGNWVDSRHLLTTTAPATIATPTTVAVIPLAIAS